MTRRLLLPLPTMLLLAACSAAESLLPGNDETDRIAQVVSDAISWPRQDSPMGYARAAADTTAAEDGRLTVVDITELQADSREEPFTELMFLVHLDGSTGGWIETEPVTACYRAAFGYDGLVGSPHRTRCPDDAPPLDISPAPPQGPVAEIADDADRVLRAELRELGATPEPAALEAALDAALPVGAHALPPEVEVAVDGSSVGVSVRGDDQCLLGARIAGKVEVWRPSAVQLRPGELTCDPATALGQLGQQAPH